MQLKGTLHETPLLLSGSAVQLCGPSPTPPALHKSSWEPGEVCGSSLSPSPYPLAGRYDEACNMQLFKTYGKRLLSARAVDTLRIYFTKRGSSATVEISVFRNSVIPAT